MLRLLHEIYNKVSNHFAYKRLGGRKGIKEIQWALNLKEGDLINTCSSWPFNIRMTKILSFDKTTVSGWCVERKGRKVNPAGYVITGVTVESTDGRQHTFESFGQCCNRPLTNEEIRAEIVGWADSADQFRKGSILQLETWEGRPATTEELAKIERRVAMWLAAVNGDPICDEFGFRLPKFD